MADDFNPLLLIARDYVAKAKAKRLSTSPGKLAPDWGRAVEAAFPSLWRPHMCEVPGGWVDIILAFSEHVVADKLPITVEDSKEKFGGLRLNLSSDDMSWEALDLGEVYEQLSFEICQDCGEPGVLRTDRGWDATLCNAHAYHRGPIDG